MFLEELGAQARRYRSCLQGSSVHLGHSVGLSPPRGALTDERFSTETDFVTSSRLLS